MILDTVLATIRRHDMLASGDRVLVAVSGGPDSVALLHILLDLRTVLPLSLTVAHLDHGLREGESKRDRVFVESLSRALGIDCVSGREEVAALARKERRSIEEAGRVARRRFLRRIAEVHGCRRVAFGHQRDDQAESVLLRLVAGAGRGGLSGIKPVSADLFVRPLLECGRAEILRYLEDRGIEFMIDSSNQDHRFPRNRIRNTVLPLLAREFNTRVVEAIARTAELIRDEDAYLERAARRTLRALLSSAGNVSGFVLDAGSLARLTPAIGRRVVRLALREAGLRGRDLAKARIDDVLELARRDETNVSLSLGESFVARLEYGRLVLGRDPIVPDTAHPRDPTAPTSKPHGRSADPEARAQEGALESSVTTDSWEAEPAIPDSGSSSVPGPAIDVMLPMPGSAVVGALGINVMTRIVPIESVVGEFTRAPSNRAYLDADLLAAPLVLRGPRPGDRFRPLGAPGTRKLSDIWSDLRLSHEDRRRCLLVESAGRIVWAVGLRTGHSFRVTDRTRRVAVIESRPVETPHLDPGSGAVDTRPSSPARAFRGAEPSRPSSPDRILFTPEQIAEAVDGIAREVADWAAGRELVLLGVLHGSFIFLSDLLRRLPSPVRVGFLDREGTLISQGMSLEKALVLVVEDIFDSGESLTRVLARVQEHRPAEIRICALFDKVDARRSVPLELDFRGLAVPDVWVVGYGLDQDGRLRNLPYLTYIDPDDTHRPA